MVFIAKEEEEVNAPDFLLVTTPPPDATVGTG